MYVDLSIWEFPLSIILAIAYVMAVLLCSNITTSVRWKWMATTRFARYMIAVVALLIGVEGTWPWQLFHTWVFIALILVLMIPLGIAVLQEYHRRTYNGAFFSHIGLFLVLLGGLFGAADTREGQLVVSHDNQEHMAYTREGFLLPLPFQVQLVDFQIDYYEDGMSPKQYTSQLLVDGQPMETSVNHPCSYQGYHIYQSDYDHLGLQYSVLKVVSDPWLPLVYVGMALLVIGAILSLRNIWNNRWVLPVVGMLTVLFSLFSLARINFGTLMPALRSLWFVPHLIIYMVAYSVLAIASVIGIAALIKDTISTSPIRKLLFTGSSLLLIGMLCGAVWAKAAWGQYWTWDAKENWAAVTWMLTLIGMHLHPDNNRRSMIILVLLSFLAMQITWYGVNYLPSASNSLHTYNQ